MNQSVVNAIVGVLQVVVPAVVTFALGKGWINANELSGIASILAGLGFTGWSSLTTAVNSAPTPTPTPPAK